MRRRELMLVLGGGVMLAPALRAQQKAMPVIGCLSISPPPPSLADLSHDLVHEGLRELGYVDGQSKRGFVSFGKLDVGAGEPVGKLVTLAQRGIGSSKVV